MTRTFGEARLREHVLSTSRHRVVAMAMTEAYKKIARSEPGEPYAIFNCPKWHNIAAMFYTSGTAYDRLPTEAEHRRLREQRIPMLVFDDGDLPAYVRSDPEVKRIPLPAF
jgi:hypothetical protein